VKAKWIDEVAELLRSDVFAAWYEGIESVRHTHRNSIARHEETLTQVNLLEFRAELANRRAIETLERANTLEDLSAELANEAAELENASFEVVSQFEMQRDRCTKLWEQLGGLDVKIEEATPDQKKRFERQRASINEEYEREDQRKQRLWSEVERLWLRSIDCNLALRERQLKATLVRAEAEHLFQVHSSELDQATDLRAKAEQCAMERDAAEHALNAAREDARLKFECLLTEDFLYWLSREDNKVVYAVSLIADNEHYGIAVEPGMFFRCDPVRGIDSLERIALDDEGRPVGAPDRAS